MRIALAALLLACATPIPERVLVVPVARPPVAERIQRVERCRLPPPPAEPEINWMPTGCPSAFGACLSGADAMRMAIYLHTVAEWKRNAEGCNRGE